jgi:hypothetical protein
VGQLPIAGLTTAQILRQRQHLKVFWRKAQTYEMVGHQRLVWVLCWLTVVVTAVQRKPQLVKREVAVVRRLAHWVLVLMEGRGGQALRLAAGVAAVVQVDRLQLLVD